MELVGEGRVADRAHASLASRVAGLAEQRQCFVGSRVSVVVTAGAGGFWVEGDECAAEIINVIDGGGVADLDSIEARAGISVSIVNKGG